jgi:hypothetical protein
VGYDAVEVGRPPPVDTDLHPGIPLEGPQPEEPGGAAVGSDTAGGEARRQDRLFV